ncbi:MAG: class II aldolase/adducin family protein [Chromatiales bacterium]|jgi:L-fuculose-phosphate aldolase
MDIREELVRHYRWLREHGCNDSHSGNASAREDDTVWITPTGACADALRPEDLVPCRLDGRLGDNASADAPLHIAVYRRNPEAHCVLHSHGPHSVALSLSGADFEPVDFEGQYYFPRVPVLEVPYERYFVDSPERVAEALTRYPVVIVRGHGVYAWGDSIDQAYKWSCSLELSAKTAWIARLTGTAL